MRNNDINIQVYYKKYGPMILRRCRFLLKEEDLALDAMHDVFVNLLINKKTIKDNYPSSLLFTMATNICLNIIRKNTNSGLVSDNSILEKIVVYEENEKEFLLRKMIELIFFRDRKSTRELAVMSYVDGMTLKEISKETGLSESGIRLRLKNLKQKIKEGGDLWVKKI